MQTAISNPAHPKRADFLAAAEAISPLIRAEAVAAEAASELTDPVVAALKDTRLYWMLLPTEMGGGGSDLVTAIEVMEELVAADGSTGWAFMANSLTTAFAAAFVGDGGAEAMFGGATPGLTAGMLAPAGRATLVEGGLQAGGRFAFGSGSAQADWMGAGMMLMKDGAPIMDAEGRPKSKICYLPRDRVEFLGNWDVCGLSATGSYDYLVPEQFFATDFTAEGGLGSPLPPRRGGGLFNIGLMGFVGIAHVAFPLGMMKRALQEVADVAVSKKRLGYTSTVANHDIFKRDFSVHESAYRAGRAYCMEVFSDVQATALAGGFPTAEQNARMRVVATWLTQVAMDVTRFCHVWAGSASIRNPSALGRCTRDMHAGSQHMIVDPITLAQFAPPILETWTAARTVSTARPAAVH